MIWNNLEDFSFMMINTMIAIKLPGVANIIQVVLLNLIQVDILQSDKWLDGLFEVLNLTLPD
jgi:hypothetical protein